jgi:hypothetical protein
VVSTEVRGSCDRDGGEFECCCYCCVGEGDAVGGYCARFMGCG